jgi:hypothetical protein
MENESRVWKKPGAENRMGYRGWCGLRPHHPLYPFPSTAPTYSTLSCIPAEVDAAVLAALETKSLSDAMSRFWENNLPPHPHPPLDRQRT